MQLLLKALIGAALAVLIEALTKSKNYFIAGLIPLFPAFALMSHYTIGTQRSVSDLKNTVLFSIFSLIPYFAYLISMYYLADRARLRFSLLLAVLSWGIVASILILVWRRP